MTFLNWVLRQFVSEVLELCNGPILLVVKFGDRLGAFDAFRDLLDAIGLLVNPFDDLGVVVGDVKQL